MTTDPSSRVRISGDPQPLCGPSTSAYVMAATPATKSTCPAQSKRCSVGSRDSRTKMRVTTTAATPISGLTQKMLRQPNSSVSTPPTVGPMANPTAAMPVQLPMALALAAGSVKAAPTSASEATLTMAAPVPCRPREMFSTISDGAMPHPIEAAQNRTMPPTYARRRPRRVREGGGRHHEHAHRQAVCGDDPLQALLAGVELALDVREGHVHDRGVEEDHEQPEAGRHEHHGGPGRRRTSVHGPNLDFPPRPALANAAPTPARESANFLRAAGTRGTGCRCIPARPWSADPVPPPVRVWPPPPSPSDSPCDGGGGPRPSSRGRTGRPRARGAPIERRQPASVDSCWIARRGGRAHVGGPRYQEAVKRVWCARAAFVHTTDPGTALSQGAEIRR